VKKHLIIVLGLWLISVTGIEAKSYQIDGVDIKATAEKSGAMQVSEKRTYRFDGSYTFAYREILKTASGRGALYRISGVTICEIDGCYRQLTLGEINNADEIRTPRTFYFKDLGDRYYIKWFYKADSITKYFKLSYKIDNAVTLHQNIAEIYWQWVGYDWELSQNNVKVKVEIPKNVDGKEIQAWGHGPLDGVVSIGSNPSVLRTAPQDQGAQDFFNVLFSVPNLSSKTFLP